MLIFNFLSLFFHLFPRASSIFYSIYHKTIVETDWFFFHQVNIEVTNFSELIGAFRWFFKTNKCKWKLTLKYGVYKSVVMEYGYYNKLFQLLKKLLNNSNFQHKCFPASQKNKKNTHTEQELLEFKWNPYNMSSISLDSINLNDFNDIN